MYLGGVGGASRNKKITSKAPATLIENWTIIRLKNWSLAVSMSAFSSTNAEGITKPTPLPMMLIPTRAAVHTGL